jgi:SAM-dependent methyltransferase
MNPPDNYSIYYSSDYYSFVNHGRGIRESLKRFLVKRRDLAYFKKAALVGRLLLFRYDECALRSISRLGLPRSARVLDVGCGWGKLLHRMSSIGFRHLLGIDPFASNCFDDRAEVRIQKCNLEDVEGQQFDLIMFHHSLEHMLEPLKALHGAARLLARNGKCLVRLPIVARAWEIYGRNWVQLDPPRHMWLPTERGMRSLAQSAGLNVEYSEFDSTGFQFWGSELYARDISLKEAQTMGVRSLFSGRQFADYRKQAKQFNEEGTGDQAAFVLTRL